MGEIEPQTHFGVNCRHLRRDEYPPADGRCALAVKRYAAPEYSFLETKTGVPLKVAQKLLGLSQDEIIRSAKTGKCEWFFPENIAERVTLFTKAGERQFTISEASKRLHLSVTQLERRIAAGELKAFIPDEFMRVVLPTRWEYEKCPLFVSGGMCMYFQSHDGHQIQCLAEALNDAKRAE